MRAFSETCGCTGRSYSSISCYYVSFSSSVFFAANLTNRFCSTSCSSAAVNVICPLSIKCDIGTYLVGSEIPRICVAFVGKPAVEHVVSSDGIFRSFNETVFANHNTIHGLSTISVKCYHVLLGFKRLEENIASRKRQY